MLNHELGKGVSYPKARESALMMYLNDIKRYANILSGSNNILAIEYLKALKKLKSNIKPFSIQRTKVYYNDEKIFTVNKDETITKKTTVDGELTVGKTKFVPMATASDGLNIVILD